MTTTRSKGKPSTILTALSVLGLVLSMIPFFLTPPAFLVLALRDSVFQSDLTGKRALVTDDASGKTLGVEVQKSDGAFLARVGRVDSGGTRPFTIKVEGYKPSLATVATPPMHRIRATVDLVPAFGRLEVSVVNSAHDAQPVVASLKEGNAGVSPGPQSAVTLNLAPGLHRLYGQAPGFCSGEKEYGVEEGKLTRVKFPLTPDLSGDEIARFVLDWGDKPRDLDAHFRKLSVIGSSAENHVYFKHKEIETKSREVFARLDVDHQNSEGYETVTIYRKAEGDYEYYVHLYAGEGTLGGSGATVEGFTRGCLRELYTVPPDCSGNIWAVTLLRASQGRVERFGPSKCVGPSP